MVVCNKCTVKGSEYNKQISAGRTVWNQRQVDREFVCLFVCIHTLAGAGEDRQSWIAVVIAVASDCLLSGLKHPEQAKLPQEEDKWASEEVGSLETRRIKTSVLVDWIMSALWVDKGVLAHAQRPESTGWHAGSSNAESKGPEKDLWGPGKLRCLFTLLSAPHLLCQ